MFAVAPMLAVVAAAVMKSSSGSGKWMTCAIVVASIVMQLTGIAALVSAKRHNAELTHWLASRTVQGEVLISNVYWFPEVTATLAPNFPSTGLTMPSGCSSIAISRCSGSTCWC